MASAVTTHNVKAVVMTHLTFRNNYGNPILLIGFPIVYTTDSVETNRLIYSSVNSIGQWEEVEVKKELQ